VSGDTPFSVQSLGSPAAGSVSSVYDLEPSGTSFALPATLTFRYAGIDLGGVDPQTLAVATLTAGGGWSAVPSTVNPGPQTVVAAVSHFSKWALVVGPATICTPTITEFPLPAPYSLDQTQGYGTVVSGVLYPDIVQGRDGNVWFGNANVGAQVYSLGQITPSGSIQEFVSSLGDQIDAITVTPDGNLWVTDNNFDIDQFAASGVESSTCQVEDPEDDVVMPGITAAPDGSLWYTWDETPRDPAGRALVCQLLLPISDHGHCSNLPGGGSSFPGLGNCFEPPTANSFAYDIVAGPDGNMWFTEYGGNSIARITPAGVIREFPVPTANSAPSGIAVGPDGNLWFTEFNGNSIGQITPAGVVREFAVPTPGSQPAFIAAGPDGNLWFTEYHGNQIGRITTAGAIVEIAIPTASSAPVGITAGPDGNVWFTEYKGNNIGKVALVGCP
jgi:streptogramin lyase